MAYKKHEHNFVPPGNDDEQQCDNDCRTNWHKCSTCKKSQAQVAKEHPAEVRGHVTDTTQAIIRALRTSMKKPTLNESIRIVLACAEQLDALTRERLVELAVNNERAN